MQAVQEKPWEVHLHPIEVRGLMRFLTAIVTDIDVAIVTDLLLQLREKQLVNFTGIFQCLGFFLNRKRGLNAPPPPDDEVGLTFTWLRVRGTVVP